MCELEVDEVTEIMAGLLAQEDPPLVLPTKNFVKSSLW